MRSSKSHDLQKTSRKKVLALSMQAPRSPGAGGETRSYYFLKALAEDTDLTLISLGGVDGSGRIQADIVDICENIIEPMPTVDGVSQIIPSKSRASRLATTLSILIFPSQNRWESFLNLFVQYCLPENSEQDRSPGKRLLTGLLKSIFRIAARFSAIPPMTTFMFYRSFQQCHDRLQRDFSDHDFDMIWCEHATMYPLLLRIQQIVNSPVMICNSHNIETQLQVRFADLAQPGWATEYWRLQATIFSRVEQQCYSNSDLTFVCSQEDKRYGISLAPNGKYRVVGNGVNSTYFQSPTENNTCAEPTLVFTGGFGYEPNRDAVHFFVKEILPEIWQHWPDCKFLFAGFEAERLWSELATNDERIQYECSPVDIRPCFQRATIVVVPLRVGGGTRLKVLEAMSMGRAIVSTTLGAEGIPCESGKHLVLADTPSEFATTVVRLLHDRDTRSSIGNHAADWVRNHFDWTLLSMKIHAELSSLL